MSLVGTILCSITMQERKSDIAQEWSPNLECFGCPVVPYCSPFRLLGWVRNRWCSLLVQNVHYTRPLHDDTISARECPRLSSLPFRGYSIYLKDEVIMTLIDNLPRTLYASGVLNASGGRCFGHRKRHRHKTLPNELRRRPLLHVQVKKTSLPPQVRSHRTTPLFRTFTHTVAPVHAMGGLGIRSGWPSQIRLEQRRSSCSSGTANLLVCTRRITKIESTPCWD